MQNKAPDLLMHMMRLTILLTLTVIVLGAYTRLSDAGLGCPDWPGCYGKITVPSNTQAVNQANLQFPERALEADKAWIEMIHRYFAGTLGLLIFVVVAWCIKKNITAAGLPLLISATVIFQALLGMWTVTLKLMPVVVMAHLMGASRCCHCYVCSTVVCLNSKAVLVRLPILHYLKSRHYSDYSLWLGRYCLVAGHRLIMPLWCVPNYLSVKGTGQAI